MLFLVYPDEAACNYRKSYRYLAIGLSYKVVVILLGDLLQSGRGCPYKVVVDNEFRIQPVTHSPQQVGADILSRGMGRAQVRLWR